MSPAPNLAPGHSPSHWRNGGEEKLSQTQAPHFREARAPQPGDAGALHSTTAERVKEA